MKHDASRGNGRRACWRPGDANPWHRRVPLPQGCDQAWCPHTRPLLHVSGCPYAQISSYVCHKFIGSNLNLNETTLPVNRNSIRRVLWELRDTPLSSITAWIRKLIGKAYHAALSLVAYSSCGSPSHATTSYPMP